jgi:hypothetical protein
MMTENMGKKRYGLDTSTKARLCIKKKDSLVVHIPIFNVTVKIHLQPYTAKQESYAAKQHARQKPQTPLP